MSGVVLLCQTATTAVVVVTVWSTVTGLCLATTEVRVTGAGIEGALAVTTDDHGIFSIVVTELAEGGSLVAEQATFDVVSSDDLDRYRLVFPDVAGGAEGTAFAYLGVLYELTLRYRSERAPDGANREARFELEPRLYDDDALGALADYQLVLSDNYSLADLTETGALGAGGDVTSRPAAYDAAGWTQHVSPAIGLRVVVRKRRRNAYVALGDGEVVARFTVIDPPEQYGPLAIANRPAAWLTAFHDTMRGDRPSDEHGNKNCPRRYGGLRENNGGVRAASVLYTGTGPFQALTVHAETQVVLPIVPADREGPVGDGDLFFCPAPIGGDSYRLRISLHNAGGDELPFADGPGRPLATRLSTGVITVWRSLSIKLGIPLADVQDETIWDEVDAAYAQAYTRIDRSQMIDYPISSASFDTKVREAFSGTTIENWPDGVLLPGSLQLHLHEDTIEDRLIGITKAIVSRAAVQRHLADPNGVAVPGGHGFFVVFCKLLMAGSVMLGRYTGVGQFYSVQRRDFTHTFVHEMGHALFLRHGLTQQVTRRRPAVGWTGPAVTECALVPTDNFYDHDPADLVCCTMSYRNDTHVVQETEGNHPVAGHFCAVCLLKLRHWDTVRMRNHDPFKALLLDATVPDGDALLLVRDPRDRTCGNPRCASCWALSSAAFTVHLAEFARVRAVAIPDATLNNDQHASVVDLSLLADCTWSSSNTAAITVDQGFLTPVGLGASDVTCTFNARHKTVRVTVAAARRPFERIHARRIRVAVADEVPVERDTFTLFDDEQTWLVKINGTSFYRVPLGTQGAEPTELARLVFRVPGEGEGDLEQVWTFTPTADLTFDQTLEGSVYGDENIPVATSRFHGPDGVTGTITFV